MIRLETKLKTVELWISIDFNVENSFGVTIQVQKRIRGVRKAIKMKLYLYYAENEVRTMFFRFIKR